MKKIVLSALLLMTSWTMMKAEVSHAIGLQVGFERQLYMLNSPSATFRAFSPPASDSNPCLPSNHESVCTSNHPCLFLPLMYSLRILLMY